MASSLTDEQKQKLQHHLDLLKIATDHLELESHKMCSVNVIKAHEVALAKIQEWFAGFTVAYPIALQRVGAEWVVHDNLTGEIVASTEY